MKLGGSREAGNAMGKLLRSVASGLADEESIREVCTTLILYASMYVMPVMCQKFRVAQSKHWPKMA